MTRQALPEQFLPDENSYSIFNTYLPKPAGLSALRVFRVRIP